MSLQVQVQVQTGLLPYLIMQWIELLSYFLTYSRVYLNWLPICLFIVMGKQLIKMRLHQRLRTVALLDSNNRNHFIEVCVDLAKPSVPTIWGDHNLTKSEELWFLVRRKNSGTHGKTSRGGVDNQQT